MIVDPQNQEFQLTVTTGPGLEELLSDELSDLGVNPQQVGFGAVSLAGSWDKVARILIHCRLGSRLLLNIAEFSARNEAMLYSQVRRIDWLKWFHKGQTFSVRVQGDFKNTTMARSFAPLKIKDAICDEFRKRCGGRPSVNRSDADVPVVAFFRGGRCTLSLDLAGEPMYRRGYRQEGAVAPIKEHRAAALLRFLGYDGSRAFVDPFCGSGTLVIEAALIATGRPPGLLRRPNQFAASRFSKEAREAIEAIWDMENKAPRASLPRPVRGADRDADSIAIAKANASRAGLENDIRFDIADARQIEAPEHDIACNPPYGERLGEIEEATELVASFAGRVRSHCPGARMALVLPHGPLTKNVGLRADRKLPVKSAPLDLRFVKYSIFSKSPSSIS